MIRHMRHGSPPRLTALQSILSPNRRESLTTPSPGVRMTGPIRTPEVFGLDSPTGANVEDVALGLRAFKVVTAEGAALGLWALGLIADAAALGLAELGPVAVGAEPGTGL